VSVQRCTDLLNFRDVKKGLPLTAKVLRNHASSPECAIQAIKDIREAVLRCSYVHIRFSENEAKMRDLPAIILRTDLGWTTDKSINTVLYRLENVVTSQ
jgi:hypothetical protein